MSVKRGARAYLRLKGAPVFVAFWVVAGAIAWAVLLLIMKILWWPLFLLVMRIFQNL